jgi:hypothetical protein
MPSPTNINHLELKKKVHGAKTAGSLIMLILIIAAAVAITMIIVNNFAK